MTPIMGQRINSVCSVCALPPEARWEQVVGDYGGNCGDVNVNGRATVEQIHKSWSCV